MMGRGNKNGGKTKAQTNGDDDETFRSLLERVDDVLETGPSTRKVNTGAPQGQPTGAPQAQPSGPQPVTAGSSPQEIAKLMNAMPRPSEGAGDPSTGPGPRQGNNLVVAPSMSNQAQQQLQLRNEAVQKLARMVSGSSNLADEKKWYYKNWAVIGVSMLVSLVVSLPLVVFLSYKLQSAKQSVQSTDGPSGLPAATELFSRPPPAGTPRLLQGPRRLRQANPLTQNSPEASGAMQRLGAAATGLPANLPRMILASRILLSGEQSAPLGLGFEPYALLPEGSFVMISGLPSEVEIEGGRKYGVGVWIVEARNAAAAKLRAQAAKPGTFKIVANLMAPGGRAINREHATVIIGDGSANNQQLAASQVDEGLSAQPQAVDAEAEARRKAAEEEQKRLAAEASTA